MTRIEGWKGQGIHENHAKIRMLHIFLSFDLSFHELGRFRGGMVKKIGETEDLLHNHLPGKKRYHYRYPLIHYRVNEGKAMLLGINEGADLLLSSLMSLDHIVLGKIKVPIVVQDMYKENFNLKSTNQLQYYRLHHWLPLNEENYLKWLKMDNLHSRINLLEKVLAANIISFAKGISWQIEQHFEVGLVDLIQHRVVKVHNDRMMAFDIVYKTNLVLPPQIALGRAVSHGFGWQIPYRKKA